MGSIFFCSRFKGAFGALVFLAVAPVDAVPPGGEAAAGAAKEVPGLTAPTQLEVELWADSPMLANPVAFCFDEQGRVYVAETYRQGTAVSDNRGHAYWLDDDKAAMTTEDRVAKYEKWQGRTPLATYTGSAEQVRLLQDSDGDGKADRSGVFAGPFNEMLDGTAAGLLAKDGDIWLTCIPHLWRLRDTDGDGKADQKDKLYSGFGVRDAFRGHDMHGLVLGPDGWLYFNMADRGYNVTLPDGSRLTDAMDAGRGAVFRCRTDGSGLEVFYRGLRNPQEMAFNEFGELFTVDNNSDSEDQARLVHLVEGGDSGWSMVFQYGTPAHTEANYNRGPWNAEKLWHLRHEGQAAWILPPLAHFTNGPSGLVYEPGVTSLGADWRGSFFVVDFKGTPAQTGIWNFRVEADGAGYKMGKLEKFVWNVAATDCDFGPDGRFYLTDFINGWVGTGEGRIWALSHPEARKEVAVREVEAIFRAGFPNQKTQRLASLLTHADMRVRVRAQHALGERAATDQSVEGIFAGLASQEGPLVPRLHGVWGLSMVGSDSAAGTLAKLITDKESLVRAQAARMLGDLKAKAQGGLLAVQFEKEAHPVVRAQMAMALGKLGVREATPRMMALLAENDDRDVVLRHALSLGLSRLVTAEGLGGHRGHASRAVRLGCVLALRHQLSATVSAYLKDTDPLIVLEAARVIYDTKGVDAMSELAALLEEPDWLSAQPEPLVLRVLHAAARSGGAEAAARLAGWAVHEKAAEASRREALHLLATWAAPEPFDRVTGYYRPQKAREAKAAAAALAAELDALLEAKPAVVQGALKAAAALEVKVAGEVLARMALRPKLAAELRADLVDQLASQKAPELAAVVESLLKEAGTPARVRIAAARALMEADAGGAVAQLLGVIRGQGRVEDGQLAIGTLARAGKPEALAALNQLVEQVNAGALTAALHLDVLEAAREFGGQITAATVAAWDAAHPATDMLAPFSVCLEGGSVARGQDIFANGTAAQCMRCHKVNGGGGMAGPELSKIGVAEHATAEYLLEAIVNPSAKIVPGYGMASVVLKDGTTHSGVIKSESADELVLVDGSGKDLAVAVGNIAQRTPTISSMPPMGLILSKRDVRDLVAYLRHLGQDGKEVIE